MRRATALLLLVVALAGCRTPLIRPDAGPGAVGYSRGPAPPPPEVLVTAATAPPADQAPPGGSLDSVEVREGELVLTGWALLDPAAPRGQLLVSLPADVEARDVRIEALSRADVQGVLGRPDLAYAGFQVVVTLPSTPPVAPPVCVSSRSSQGQFVLPGSDDALCRSGVGAKVGA